MYLKTNAVLFSFCNVNFNKKSNKFWNILSRIDCYRSLAHFERFGGDPLKRSISNQITSHMSIVYLIIGLSSSTLHVSSFIFGQYPYWLGVTIAMCEWGTFTFILIGLSIILIFRNLYLYKFAIASGFNDDFFSHYFLMFNLILSFGSQISR